MKRIDVPGWGSMDVKNLVLDLNGTMTESGSLIPGVVDYLARLKDHGIKIYVLSGDTRGTVKKTFQDVAGVEAVVTKTAGDKKDFVDSIGPACTVCVGNGNIDVEMFRVSRLAICTVQAEGAATRAIMNADIVVTHICEALDILLDEDKLIATLRS